MAIQIGQPTTNSHVQSLYCRRVAPNNDRCPITTWPRRQSDEYADKAEELVAFQEKLTEGAALCGRKSEAGSLLRGTDAVYA